MNAGGTKRRLIESHIVFRAMSHRLANLIPLMGIKPVGAWPAKPFGLPRPLVGFIRNDGVVDSSPSCGTSNFRQLVRYILQKVRAGRQALKRARSRSLRPGRA